MRLDVGTIAHWRDFTAGHDKYVYILGTNDLGEVLSFTISSQTKYLSLTPHKYEMVEIPHRQTDFLDRPSYIQCFFELTRTHIDAFKVLERNGSINYRGCMPQFIPQILAIATKSVLLAQDDCDSVIAICAPK